MEEYSPVRYTVEERRYLLMMKWIKRLCSLILLCLLIAGGILLFQGYREYREALSGKSVEEMARQIESIDNFYFGNGYQCVGDACRAYFGKEPSEMTFDECTLLAGIPNAPSNYNPMASEELAHQRQQQVLEKMKKAGYLD